MVDLGLGLVTASLPVIIGLIPRASSPGNDAFDHSASPTAKTGAYLRSLTRNHMASGGASRGQTSSTGLTSLDPDQNEIPMEQLADVELMYLPRCQQKSQD